MPSLCHYAMIWALEWTNVEPTAIFSPQWGILCLQPVQTYVSIAG